MAKNERYMTTKEKLSRFRNLTKGRLLKQKESIHKNILHALPDGCLSLSNDEITLLRTITSAYNDILASWNYRTRELIKRIDNNE